MPKQPSAPAARPTTQLRKSLPIPVGELAEPVCAVAEIPYETTELHCAIERLNHELDQLIERLTPISTSEHAPEQLPDFPSPSTDVGRSIRTANSAIQLATARLRAQLNNLAL